MPVVEGMVTIEEAYNTTSASTNVTTPETRVGLPFWQVITIGSLATLTSLLTIIGNLTVLLSFILERSIRQTTNYFIASLAVSDLLIGTISMPLYSVYLLSDQHWMLGEVLCDLWLSLDYTVCLSSIYTVFCITIDRYCSVTIPARYHKWRTERKVLVILCIVWTVPVVVFFTSIIGWQYFVHQRTVPSGKCYVQYMENALFNCLLQVGYFWVTLAFMCVLYAGIYRAALRLHRKSESRRQKMTSVVSMAGETMARIGVGLTGQQGSDHRATVDGVDDSEIDTRTKQSGNKDDGCSVLTFSSDLERSVFDAARRSDVLETFPSHSKSSVVSPNDGELPPVCLGPAHRRSEFICSRKRGVDRVDRVENVYMLLPTDDRIIDNGQDDEELEANGSELCASMVAEERCTNRPSVKNWDTSKFMENWKDSTEEAAVPCLVLRNNAAMEPDSSISSRNLPTESGCQTIQCPSAKRKLDGMEIVYINSRAMKNEMLEDNSEIQSSRVNHPDRSLVDGQHRRVDPSEYGECFMQAGTTWILPIDESNPNDMSSFDSDKFYFKIDECADGNRIGEPRDGKGSRSRPCVGMHLTNEPQLSFQSSLESDVLSPDTNTKCRLIVTSSNNSSGSSNAGLRRSLSSAQESDVPPARHRSKFMGTRKFSSRKRRSCHRKAAAAASEASSAAGTVDSSGDHHTVKNKRENRAFKSLRTISFILGAFVCCWTPWHVLSLIIGFCSDSPGCVPPVLYDISYWLCYLNSPINPFCYAFANQQFKKTFVRILSFDWHKT